MSTINTYIIPLTTDPQTFEILLAGATYTLTSKWNDIAQGWFLDIADSNAVPLAAGLPLITGADLLSGLEYLGIGGSFFVFTNGLEPDTVPTLFNLGADSNLYFQTVSADE